MATTRFEKLAPLAVSRPPPPDDVLTASQWTTLLAIADTIVPSVRPAPSADPQSNLVLSSSDYALTVAAYKEIAKPGREDLVEQYLAECPSSIPEFRQYLTRLLGSFVPDDAKKGISFLLTTIGSRIGSLVFTGSRTPFELYTVKEREALLQGWINSYLPPVQQAYKAFGFLVKIAWIMTSQTVDHILGVPRTPKHGVRAKGFDYGFLHFNGEEPETVETDIVIIGSGCGGGVAAKNLSEAGHKVIVVDKGYYHPPEYLPMEGWEAGMHLFENGGFQNSDDNTTTAITGSCWGGGGTVNWSASLQTEGSVRREWASQGLPFFESAEFQTCLDRVCDRMGVSTKHIRHNPANATLLEGSRKLGWAAKDVPQNTGFQEHYCGYCTLGCESSVKQGPVVSFLPDAVKAGARCIEGFEVKNIDFESRSGIKTATGLRGIWTSRDEKDGFSGNCHSKEIVIKAKKVISAAGTLWSPVLLLKSGLKNPQIGRNYHCHPVKTMIGVSSEITNPWEGGILTSVCTEFQNLDGLSHGVKIEAGAMVPAFNLPFLPWIDGIEYKKMCLKFKKMSCFMAISRDRDSGRIYPDPKTGKPRVVYNPSAFDKAHIMEGIISAAKMFYVTGHEEIHAAIPGILPFVRDSTKTEEESEGINNQRFQEWLSLIRDTGLNTTSFASAHQMGSCRMGANERTSVVDPKGKVWGVEGLYVSDASVFPSASGVNPMITNMAISDYISRTLSKDMTEQFL